ncbi:MAG: esterase [Planctomycetes bacterium]|nr:esterase [Planctomycetota bacterium]
MRAFAILFLLLTILPAQTEREGVQCEWDVDGIKRRALVYMPSGEARIGPIVFAYHGHFGSSAQAARSFGLHKLWPEALVVYPQGLLTISSFDPKGEGAGWQLHRGSYEDRDLKFFDKLRTDFANSGWLDPAALHVMGHSNGGAFAYLLMQARGGDLASIAPSAATIGALGQAPVTVPVAVLHVAGSKDNTVSFARQARSMRTLRKTFCCAQKGEEWAPGALRYPGGSADFVAFIHPGTHVYAKDASALMVRFFKEHRKGAAVKPALSEPHFSGFLRILPSMTAWLEAARWINV